MRNRIKKNKAALILVSIVVCGMYVGGAVAHAQNLLPPQVREEIGGTFGGSEQVLDKDANKEAVLLFIAKVINWALTTVSLIFLIFIVYAGYRYMTAGGESEPREQAIKTIKTAVIGLAIVLGSFIITRFVLGALISQPSSTPYPGQVAGTVEALINRE